MPAMRFLASVVSSAATAAFLTLSACASLHGRDDLDVEVFRHHNNLRWGRLANAAIAVKPELREAFVKDWAARSGVVELQDIEVAGVLMDPQGAFADVVVNITYIERDTMQVKSVTATERWARTDAGWLVEKPAEL